MAKNSVNMESLCGEIVAQARQGVFKPVYLLMGDEPYYTDRICDAIVENALDESERDFNQSIYYGADADVEEVISTARRYPMFAERQLVVVKDAQLLRNVEQLSIYCTNPLESTVLVLLFRGTGADKRKALYKSVQKCGVVVESVQLRDYQLPDWIISFYASRGMSIDPEAARLFAEFSGTSLSRIAVETEKLMKNLPAGTTAVSVADIERNVGVSREYSIFELNKALCAKNAAAALKIASYVGSAAKFAMPMAVSAMFTQFYKVLKYDILLKDNPYPSAEEKAAVLGVNPYFFREYDTAARNFPLPKCMAVISLLCDYDYKGKGGETSQETPPGELLCELATKILNC